MNLRGPCLSCQKSPFPNASLNRKLPMDGWNGEGRGELGRETGTSDPQNEGLNPSNSIINLLLFRNCVLINWRAFILLAAVWKMTSLFDWLKFCVDVWLTGGTGARTTLDRSRTWNRAHSPSTPTRTSSIPSDSARTTSPSSNRWSPTNPWIPSRPVGKCSAPYLLRSLSTLPCGVTHVMDVGNF